MAAERGGKYLHLNARSIPPFRCFFSREPLLTIAWSHDRLRHGRLRHDRDPNTPNGPPRAARAEPAAAADPERDDGDRPGADLALLHRRGSSLDVIEKPPRGLQHRRWSSRGIHHEAGDLAGRETLHLRFSQPLHLSFLCPLSGETRAAAVNYFLTVHMMKTCRSYMEPHPAASTVETKDPVRWPSRCPQTPLRWCSRTPP